MTVEGVNHWSIRSQIESETPRTSPFLPQVEVLLKIILGAEERVSGVSSAGHDGLIGSGSGGILQQLTILNWLNFN